MPRVTLDELNAIKRRIAAPRDQPEEPIKVPGKSKWCAKKTQVNGITFASRLEARVFERLHMEKLATNAIRIYRQVRVALTNLAPLENGLSLYITVDFCVVDINDGSRRWIDAKPKKWKSREWVRGKAAFEALLNVRIQEVDR